MDIKDFEPLFHNWYVDSFIGSGSFGKVYRIKREEFGVTYYSALKWISIPQDDAELKQLRYDGMDDASISAYYKDVVKDLTNEIQLMSRLRGRSSIVSYEDHRIEPKPNEMGYEIFIRMELLTSLNEYMLNRELSRAELVRLGIDLCEALELCQKYNIIHRDIKPDNIFVTDTGDFKLGDFGIARQLEKTATGLSKKGTYNYMAPEVYKGERYNSSVDLYSLGIVMYRLLNDGRLPFLPMSTNLVRPGDREQSLVRRMSGEAMPVPQNAEGRLGEIILMACAYDPKDRYSSPKQMREELQAIQFSKEEAKVVFQEKDNLGYIEPSRKDESALKKAAEPEMTDSVFGRTPEQEPEKTADAIKSAQETGQEASERTQSVFAHAQEDRAVLGGQPDSEDRTTRANTKPHKTGRILLKIFLIILLVAAVAAFILALWMIIESNRNSSDSTVSLAPVMETAAPMPTPTEQPDYVISWQDENFERGIRNALGKSEGEPINYYEVKDIKTLTIDADETTFQFAESDYSTAKQYYEESTATYECNTLSLADLLHFTGLTTIYIFDTNIEDIAALQNCQALESVFLFGCRNVSLDWITGLPRLGLLGLRFCYEIDYSDMGSSESIENMQFYWCNLPPLNELGKLPNLMQLTLYSNQALVNVDSLAALGNLAVLDIGKCKLTNLDFLKDMQQLKDFFLNMSDIKNISGLSAMQNLQWLSFENCDSVTDLSVLSQMTNLTTLFIVECGAVTDLTPISGLTSLQSIWLNGDAKLSDISPLSGLVNLKELYFLRTKVTDITPLTGLPLERISANKNLEKSLREYFPNADIYVE